MNTLRTLFLKEVRSEWQNRQGLLVTGAFGLTAVVAQSFAGRLGSPTPADSAGMLAITLIFTASMAIPRLFLSEDEQRTIDLLRLWAPPSQIYLGKWLYGALVMILSSLVLGGLFSLFVRMPILQPGLFAAGLFGLALALTTASSVAGLLSMGASHRWLLAAAVFVPLVLPPAILGMDALGQALGGSGTTGWRSVLGLVGFGAVTIGIAPSLAHSLLRRTPLDQDS